MRFSVIVHDNLISEWDEGQYPLLKVRDHGNKNHYVCKKREEITEGSPSDHQTPPQIRTIHQRQTANRTQEVHPRSQPTYDFVSKPLKYKKSRLKHTPETLLQTMCKCKKGKKEKCGAPTPTSGEHFTVVTVLAPNGGQSTLQPWAGGAVFSAPILVSGGQRFKSSLDHLFSLLSAPIEDVREDLDLM